MPATLSPKKRPQAKKMAVRRPPASAPKAKAAAATASRSRRFSAKQVLSDKAADFFNAFLS